jgi:hypothetical protein
MESEEEFKVTPKMEYEMTSAAFRHHQTLLNGSVTVFFAFSGVLLVFASNQKIGSINQLVPIIFGSLLSWIWLHRARRWRAYNKSYLTRLIQFEAASTGLFTKDQILVKEDKILKSGLSGLVPTIYATSMALYCLALVIILYMKYQNEILALLA